MGEKVNIGVIAVIVVLFVLCTYQCVILVKMQQYNDDSQQFIDYWRHQTDSLSDETFKLNMQIYDLKDSIITLRFELANLATISKKED